MFNSVEDESSHYERITPLVRITPPQELFTNQHNDLQQFRMMQQEDLIYSDSKAVYRDEFWGTETNLRDYYDLGYDPYKKSRAIYCEKYAKSHGQSIDNTAGYVKRNNRESLFGSTPNILTLRQADLIQNCCEVDLSSMVRQMCADSRLNTWGMIFHDEPSCVVPSERINGGAWMSVFCKTTDPNTGDTLLTRKHVFYVPRIGCVETCHYVDDERSTQSTYGEHVQALMISYGSNFIANYWSALRRVASKESNQHMSLEEMDAEAIRYAENTTRADAPIIFALTTSDADYRPIYYRSYLDWYYRNSFYSSTAEGRISAIDQFIDPTIESYEHKFYSPRVKNPINYVCHLANRLGVSAASRTFSSTFCAIVEHDIGDDSARYRPINMSMCVPVEPALHPPHPFLRFGR